MRNLFFVQDNSREHSFTRILSYNLVDHPVSQATGDIVLCLCLYMKCRTETFTHAALRYLSLTIYVIIKLDPVRFVF